MIDYSIIGKRFGHLTVLSLDHITERHNTYWLCQCDCGNKTVVYRGGLTSGDTISCGCYHKEHNHEYGYKHGLTGTPLYTTWCGMNNRCRNENAANYERYGGRGISVCDEWKNDFITFHDWALSHGYEEGLSLDRINNDGNYEPSNCRWATREEQQNNRRNSHYFTYNNETHTIAEWGRILNIKDNLLNYRINKNNYMDFERYFEMEENNDEPI